LPRRGFLSRRAHRTRVAFLPGPHALLELDAPDLAAVQALGFQLALDQHLGGYPGVIGARQPQRVVAAHAAPADGHVDFGVLEHVPDVQRSGDIGRRNGQREHPPRSVQVGAENARLNPPLRPMRLKPLGFIDLLEWHGEIPTIASAPSRPDGRLASRLVWQMAMDVVRRNALPKLTDRCPDLVVVVDDLKVTPVELPGLAELVEREFANPDHGRSDPEDLFAYERLGGVLFLHPAPENSQMIYYRADFVQNPGALPACALPPDVGALLWQMREDSRLRGEQQFAGRPSIFDTIRRQRG